jgi:hypothetical protein
LSLGTAVATEIKAKPVRRITWNEAGPEIDSRRISLERLRVTGKWKASCNDEQRPVEAFGNSALAAIANLLRQIGLRQIGGANGGKTDNASKPDQSRRA